MKNLIFALAVLISVKAFAQPQPQGEFHKYIVKKTDDERKKTKSQEWWNKGVIVFSTEEIKRMATTAEVKMQNSFEASQTIYGRAFLPKSIGQLERKPESIITRFFVDGKSYKAEIIYKDDNMLDDAWSSFMYILPEDMPSLFDDLETGEHTIKIEVWSSVPTEKTTVYTDENDKALAVAKEEINRGQFLAAGEFKIVK